MAICGVSLTWIDVRTNNALEGWHRRLNGLLGRCISILQEEQLAASEVAIQLK